MDSLRKQLAQSQKEIDEILLEKDFLERYNKKLKAQCETYAEKIAIFNIQNGKIDRKYNPEDRSNYRAASHLLTPQHRSKSSLKDFDFHHATESTGEISQSSKFSFRTNLEYYQKPKQSRYKNTAKNMVNNYD